MKKTLTSCAVITLLLSTLFSCMSKRDPMTLRFYFPYHTNITDYEPAKIAFAYQYHLLENLYSPLVEIDPEGQLIGGVAESFVWKGNEAHFIIRENLKTIDGHKITIDDVVFSLKRLLVLQSNTHGNLQSILCLKEQIKSVDDPCPGIIADKNKLILKTDVKKPFLFPMLAAIDFAVIPRGSIDPTTLQIKDYKNTSGPYYVDEVTSAGDVILKPNIGHYHYKATMPQVVQIGKLGITDNSKMLVKNMASDKYDFMSSSAADLEPADLLELKKHSDQINIHQTMDLMFHVIYFSDSGIKKTAQADRLNVLKNIRAHYLQSFTAEKGYNVTTEVFPVFGEGGLLQDHKKDWRKILENPNVSISNKKLTIGILSNNYDEMKALFTQVCPDWKIISLRNNNEKITPDLIYSQIDTGFLEDIGLLSYAINADMLGDDQKQALKWLEDYTRIDDKASRLSALRSFHYKSLMAGKIMPLVAVPYFSAARKPWKMTLSSFYANLPLWHLNK